MKGKTDIFCSPAVFFTHPVTKYMLLYSTLLCRKIAHAPGERKRYKPTKLGGGGKQNRSGKTLRTALHTINLCSQTKPM